MGDDGDSRQQEQHSESAQRTAEGEGGFQIGGEIACAYDEAAAWVSAFVKSLRWRESTRNKKVRLTKGTAAPSETSRLQLHALKKELWVVMYVYGNSVPRKPGPSMTFWARWCPSRHESRMGKVRALVRYRPAPTDRIR
jgi:hypothetical protein